MAKASTSLRFSETEHLSCLPLVRTPLKSESIDFSISLNKMIDNLYYLCINCKSVEIEENFWALP